ncbi:uncharacterized protein [Battus philenor]|uniref:uncharacterized protein n=1 Tax=Battus philenor TaxID=42288 RepID=UPI0035D0734D
MARDKHKKSYNTIYEKIIYNVNCFMEKEADLGLYDLKQIEKRTAAATGCTVATVRRVVEEQKLFPTFKKPADAVPKIDPFDQGIVRRTIHHFHITEKELPTTEKLQKKLQETINFQESKRTLGRIIDNMGFEWIKTEDKRKILLEDMDLRLKRIEYLEVIENYKKEGRPIVYVDELYIESPQPKGQGFVVLQAGSTFGIIPNALLISKANAKPGKYDNNLNYGEFENWVCMQLIPNLPEKSVVVVDNLKYFNKELKPAPRYLAKKYDMKEWLHSKDISFNEDWYKPQLYKLIKANREVFIIEDILAEYNHSFLRLPPGHFDLSPTKVVLDSVKNYVNEKMAVWNTDMVKELVKEKFDSMNTEDWKEICQKVEGIEVEYSKSDLVIDLLTDEIIPSYENELCCCEDFFESDDESDEINKIMKSFNMTFISVSDGKA